MTIPIHPNDLFVLAQIFNPNGVDIYVLVEATSTSDQTQIHKDKKEIHFFVKEEKLLSLLDKTKDRVEGCLINLKKEPIIIDFAMHFPNLVLCDFAKNKNNKYNNLTTCQFAYINNRDGTIRWIYELKNKRPVFLHLYNGSGWRGIIFNTIFKIGFIIGLQNWLTSGTFNITTNSSCLKDLHQESPKIEYAIFTGTRGANRKAVLVFEAEKKIAYFLKMPLTQAAQKLTQNEYQQLKKLAKLPFKKLIIPSVKNIGRNIVLSNVKPTQSLANEKLTDKHLMALAELYQQTIFTKKLKDTIVWQEIRQQLYTIKNYDIQNQLPAHEVQYLSNLLEKCYTIFQEEHSLKMSLAHGDFTPWNCYVSSKGLHVYDWELGGELPLFYDAFHFIFQMGVLVKRLPFEKIGDQIAALEKHAIIQSLINRYQLNFQELYHFYLLRNISYYLSRYIKLVHLYPQVYWQLTVWTAALERSIRIDNKVDLINQVASIKKFPADVEEH